MFYYLFYEILFKHFAQGHSALRAFNVFKYVTFRTAYASITALVLSLIVGPWMIRKLREFKFGQEIREEGPAHHQKKRGTPTMGGVMIIGSVLVSSLLWADLQNRYLWVAIVGTLGFALVGFFDDFIKIKKKRSLGLTGKQKLLGQFLTATIVGLMLKYMTHYSWKLSVPFFKEFQPQLPFLVYLGFIMLFTVFCSNAVNLTDGLDGLAISTTVVAASALTAFVYVTGHAKFAEYLDLTKITEAPDATVAELTVFGGALVGASLGFLWFNAPPAEVFMGDVGSLGIGGALATVAVIIKQEVVLGIIGGVFVIEALSVMLQVASFKMTGKRIFKMSPLHHHFELSGWNESKIVFRFLIAALLFALLSLSTLKLR